MGSLDSHEGSGKPKSSPDVSATCSRERQEVGMTPAEDMCTPETPEKKTQTERQKVDEYFSKMEYEFNALGIKLPVDFHKGGYYTLVSKEKRPPIELVYDRMKLFFMKGKESSIAKTILHNKSKDLLEILQFHLLGKDQEANDKEIELLSKIDTKILINNLEKTIGVKFNDDQATQFLSELEANGISPKTANRLIGQIKNLSPENFKVLKGSKDLLISNLIALIIILKEMGFKAKDFVKAQLEIRARFTREHISNKREIDKNKTVVKNYGKRIANYKKEHPGVELDETLAQYEATMVDAAHNATYYEMMQVLASTKSELAFAYLNKSGKDIEYSSAKAVIDVIFQSKDSAEIKSLSSKYKVELPATLSALQNAESNFETKSVDEYIARETGNSAYARSAYDKLYKTGKVEGDDKKAIASRLAFESDKLIDISDKLAVRIDAESTFFENLLQKYKNISEVPAKEKRATALKLQSYIQLLNQHALIQGRLLSIAATYDLIGARPEKKPEDSEKRSWEKIVADTSQEAKNSNNEAKIVASFLNVKDYEGQDINQASLSRLTLTLIQKENAGLEAKYKGTMGGVSNDYGGLGNIMDQFEKAQSDPDWAEKHGTKLIRIFNQGSKAYAKIIPSVESTRGKFNEMKSDLSLALFNVQHRDSPLLKLHPQLRDVYAMVLENAIKSVDQVLDNPNSPISTQQLEKLKLAQKDFEKAKEDFLNGVLKNIAVFTIIMATAIAGGIAGSYLITGVLRTSSIFIVPIGTSAGGVIGARIGMSLTNATGLSDFKDIWDPKQMGKDFVYGYGLSLGAIMTAKGAISALKVASHSGNARVATSASRMLHTIQKAKALTSPFEVHNVKTALGRFGAKFGEEYAEESIEEAVGEIGKRINNPYLEFFVSVINASDGMNVKLNMAGVNTKKVGISTEGNRLTYVTKTPLEFIANLKAQFAGRKGSSFDAKIHPDGTIGISIYGKTLHQSIATLTIYPSTKVTTESQSVEVKPKRQQSRARNLAEKISNSEIGKTAIEIVDELFGDTVKKSKTVFLKTVEKFKTIGVYLAKNSSELFGILNQKILKESHAFGISGTQIFTILGGTIVDFIKLKLARRKQKSLELSPPRDVSVKTSEDPEYDQRVRERVENLNEGIRSNVNFISESSDLYKRANKIFEKIKIAANQPNLHLNIINDCQVNAFYVPGSNEIYIHANFLKTMSDYLSSLKPPKSLSEDHIAALMGHEITHSLQKKQTKPENELKNESKKREYEADVKGMRFMIKAGYNPQAVVELFEFLGSLNKEGGKLSMIFSVFSAHPHSQDRQDRLESMLKNPNIYIEGKQVEMTKFKTDDLPQSASYDYLSGKINIVTAVSGANSIQDLQMIYEKCVEDKNLTIVNALLIPKLKELYPNISTKTAQALFLFHFKSQTIGSRPEAMDFKDATDEDLKYIYNHLMKTSLPGKSYNQPNIEYQGRELLNSVIQEMKIRGLIQDEVLVKDFQKYLQYAKANNSMNFKGIKMEVLFQQLVQEQAQSSITKAFDTINSAEKIDSDDKAMALRRIANSPRFLTLSLPAQIGWVYHINAEQPDLRNSFMADILRNKEDSLAQMTNDEFNNLFENEIFPALNNQAGVKLEAHRQQSNFANMGENTSYATVADIYIRGVAKRGLVKNKEEFFAFLKKHEGRTIFSLNAVIYLSNNATSNFIGDFESQDFLKVREYYLSHKTNDLKGQELAASVYGLYAFRKMKEIKFVYNPVDMNYYKGRRGYFNHFHQNGYFDPKGVNNGTGFEYESGKNRIQGIGVGVCGLREYPMTTVADLEFLLSNVSGDLLNEYLVHDAFDLDSRFDNPGTRDPRLLIALLTRTNFSSAFSNHGQFSHTTNEAYLQDYEGYKDFTDDKGFKLSNPKYMYLYKYIINHETYSSKTLDDLIALRDKFFNGCFKEKQLPDNFVSLEIEKHLMAFLSKVSGVEYTKRMIKLDGIDQKGEAVFDFFDYATFEIDFDKINLSESQLSLMKEAVNTFSPFLGKADRLKLQKMIHIFESKVNSSTFSNYNKVVEYLNNSLKDPSLFRDDVIIDFVNNNELTQEQLENLNKYLSSNSIDETIGQNEDDNNPLLRNLGAVASAGLSAIEKANLLKFVLTGKKEFLPDFLIDNGKNKKISYKTLPKYFASLSHSERRLFLEKFSIGENGIMNDKHDISSKERSILKDAGEKLKIAIVNGYNPSKNLINLIAYINGDPSHFFLHNAMSNYENTIVAREERDNELRTGYVSTNDMFYRHKVFSSLTKGELEDLRSEFYDTEKDSDAQRKVLKKIIDSLDEHETVRRYNAIIEADLRIIDAEVGSIDVNINFSKILNLFGHYGAKLDEKLVQKVRENSAYNGFIYDFIDVALSGGNENDVELNATKNVVSRALIVIFDGYPPYRRVRLLQSLMESFSVGKNDPIEVKIRKIFENCGASGIKVAQYLADKPGIISNPKLREELGELKDRANPFDKGSTFDMSKKLKIARVKKIGRILGSASIKQVHEVEIENGEAGVEYVGKFKRPSLTADLDEDVPIIKALAKEFSKDKTGLSDISGKIRQMITEESDFSIEAENQRALGENLRELKIGEFTFYVPKVIEVTDSVMIEEKAKGPTLKSLEKDGKVPEGVYDAVVKSFLHQVFNNGMFHADLHQGNIYIDGKRITFIDPGLVGKIGKMKKADYFQFFQFLQEGSSGSSKLLKLVKTKFLKPDQSLSSKEKAAVLKVLADPNLTLKARMENLLMNIDSDKLDYNFAVFVKGLASVGPYMEKAENMKPFVTDLFNKWLESLSMMEKIKAKSQSI